MLEKLQIFQVLKCSNVLYKLKQQQTNIPIPIGFKLFHIMKIFEEVEDYVIKVMEASFENIDMEHMTEEQKQMYQLVLSSEIELNFEKIDINQLKNTPNVLLTLEDIENLMIIIQ